MNVLDQIKVKYNPQWVVFEPQAMTVSKGELEYLPTLVSELVDMSIATATPVEHVGKVVVIDVTPHKRQDPRLIYCPVVDLSEYYGFWKSNFVQSYENSRNKLQDYDTMIKGLNLSKLSLEEAAYLVMELLRFKNEHLRRA